MTLDNTTFQICADSPSPSLASDGQGAYAYSNVTDIQAASAESTGGCVRFYDPGMVTIISEVVVFFVVFDFLCSFVCLLLLFVDINVVL